MHDCHQVTSYCVHQRRIGDLFQEPFEQDQRQHCLTRTHYSFREPRNPVFVGVSPYKLVEH